MKQRGFTVIELLVAIVVLAGIGWLSWQQLTNVESARRDDARRSAINAMYYSLEDVFYAKNSFYPKTLTETTLTSMDKAQLNDPHNVAIGKANSDYRYEPTGCTDERCTGYTLRAIMENQADFVKKNRANN